MRIGLVGFGAGGRLSHLPYIQAAAEWSLSGVVTGSAERRRVLAAEAPGIPAYSSLDDLIDAGVDAVVVSTPPQTRRELVLRALERRVHVVADKPFAPDAATGRELRDAAERADRVLTVYQNRRWDTDLLTLRSVLDSGELGDVWRAHFVLDQDDPATLEPGAANGLLRDLGAHVVDQLTCLFGPVVQVDGHLDRVGSGAERVDGSFSLGLHHANGVYSTATGSKVCRREERAMTVYGSSGSYDSRMSDVQIDLVRAGRRPASFEGEWGLEDESRWGVLSTAAGRRTVKPVPGDYSDFYRSLHRALVDGTEPPVRLDQVLHTVAVLDAARESADTGRRVAISS
ncbi:Gfo/Idh/MocA family protein [Zhihengliuella salsuginis]|uniref:Dehydrogenase n=1 Tax=Zhihengliuella salsuginis TaxID=578222 RepID=A0ABQ3GK03_9MICC|nr:Gfo/Idh/MocA family oxidoreductase [Zhihengliuella salsuginis]GHD10386.1 dehydrogenase [Zhihengliuella salsuginis]